MKQLKLRVVVWLTRQDAGLDTCTLYQNDGVLLPAPDSSFLLIILGGSSEGLSDVNFCHPGLHSYLLPLAPASFPNVVDICGVN